MSYDISFKIKGEGLEDTYVRVGECDANITWNVREMIVKSTGLEWKNEQNNGLCKDVIPYIANGYAELTKHPEKYGTVDKVKQLKAEKKSFAEIGSMIGKSRQQVAQIYYKSIARGY